MSTATLKYACSRNVHAARGDGVIVGVALVALAVGLLFGGHPSWLPSPLRSAFVQSSNKDQIVNDVLGLLQSDYYRPINRNQLINKGLAAAVASLNDPYSHYYDPADYSSFENETNPHLSGIGIDVQTEPAGPRGRRRVPGLAGGQGRALNRGDVITHVGSTSLANRSADFSAALIKGRAGTRVTLTVQSGHAHADRVDRPRRHHGAGREQRRSSPTTDTRSATCS